MTAERFHYNKIEYENVYSSIKDPSPPFKSEFLRLIGIVSEFFLKDKISNIDEADIPRGGGVNIELEHQFDSRMFVTGDDNPGIMLEFYLSENYPFLHANLYNNSFDDYYDFINDKRQYLLTYCPEMVSKDTNEHTFCLKQNIKSNNVYKLQLTKWSDQNHVSYRQFGAADQFQKKLYSLFEQKDFIMRLIGKLEGIKLNTEA